MLNSVQTDDGFIQPSKIVCVGQNYLEHIKELGNTVPSELVVFCKQNSSITTTLNAFDGETLHYEGELSFMVTAGEFSHVGFGLDLTKRKLQKTLRAEGLPWERAKAFNGAALFSAFSRIENIQDKLDSLNFNLKINNVMVQAGSPADMLFKPLDILVKIKEFMSLADGDIIMTGTPSGVGEVVAGSTFIGTVQQNNTTIAQQSWIAN